MLILLMAMNSAPLCPVFPKEYIYADPRANEQCWVDGREACNAVPFRTIQYKTQAPLTASVTSLL